MAAPSTPASAPSSWSLTLSTFPRRTRSYLNRLPIFTRLILLAIILGVILSWINPDQYATEPPTVPSKWGLRYWGALVPKEMGLATGYRLNTYPLIHTGLIHAFVDLLALVPLMERFEAEAGTLNTAAFFLGPFSTFPGILYTLIERGIFRGNMIVMGSSVWIFLLLASDSIKTSRSNPSFLLGSYAIPTWIYPLALIVLTAILLPFTSSTLGHLCAVAIGYLHGLGYLKFMAPPEKILRWLEDKLQLLARVPHYVSIDQKVYGRYGVLPTTNTHLGPRVGGGISLDAFRGSGTRLGSVQ